MTTVPSPGRADPARVRLVDLAVSSRIDQGDELVADPSRAALHVRRTAWTLTELLEGLAADGCLMEELWP
ncbi:hypothetical protein SUDANB21_01839 [Streptomyces sp. enrichment culture]|jgi:hypothetical protein